MSLRALLADVDPGWLEGEAGKALDPALVARARDSALGRRLLGAWLADGAASALLAPDPIRDAAGLRDRWPRVRLDALCRDLGILAHAPAIRGEIGREPVRRLKASLGNSYMLALDRTVWEGILPPDRLRSMTADFKAALAGAMDAEHPASLFALFDRQGRAELRAWARRRDAALADWCALLHPPSGDVPACLPEKPVLRVYTHHETRAA